MHYFGIFPTMAMWWYSRGFKDLLLFLKSLYLSIKNQLSISIVLRTFFAPWKKTIYQKQPGLEGFRNWLLDNFISRGLGVFMRLSILIIFILINLFYLVFSISAILFWLGFPAIFLLSIYNLTQ